MTLVELSFADLLQIREWINGEVNEWTNNIEDIQYFIDCKIKVEVAFYAKMTAISDLPEFNRDTVMEKVAQSFENKNTNHQTINNQ